MEERKKKQIETVKRLLSSIDQNEVYFCIYHARVQQCFHRRSFTEIHICYFHILSSRCSIVTTRCLKPCFIYNNDALFILYMCVSIDTQKGITDIVASHFRLFIAIVGLKETWFKKKVLHVHIYAVTWFKQNKWRRICLSTESRQRSVLKRIATLETCHNKDSV